MYIFRGSGGGRETGRGREREKRERERWRERKKDRQKKEVLIKFCNLARKTVREILVSRLRFQYSNEGEQPPL